ALCLDWNEIFPCHPERNEGSYIMGNPPFLGARVMSPGQKADLISVFGPKWKNIGNMDYVTGWYKKTADLMLSCHPDPTACHSGRSEESPLTAALEYTNSITQVEQVANLWKPLMDKGIHIDFAWRTFIWDSEASQKAHVHCVIVGFSPCCHSPLAPCHSERKRRIYDGGEVIEASNINAYLMEGDNVFVESRPRPICDVPEISIGNKPIDGGFYLFKDDEKEEFVRKEPGSEKYFRRWYGSDEFINRRPRWCLWLGDANPVDLLKLPECMKRIEAVREYRLASPSPGTVKIADKPTRFHVENMPKGHYIVIPEVSSQRRQYVPMGYMDDSVLCSNKVRLLPDASLYLFGVLNSSVHMAWMRVVCGRLKSDYSYSVNIVYNNFPWPFCHPERPSCHSERPSTHPERPSCHSERSEESEDSSLTLRMTNEALRMKGEIERTARGILDAREKYPAATLADMYGNMILFPELLKAHRANDAAVLETYGFPRDASESDIVARLFKMYQELTK
ncbi:MAG: hypothetical protein IJ840_00405, partial [Bacteroidales bacterium]|nr:hypothetical protein [Bacteroidales bacterium]